MIDSGVRLNGKVIDLGVRLSREAIDSGVRLNGKVIDLGVRLNSAGAVHNTFETQSHSTQTKAQIKLIRL